MRENDGRKLDHRTLEVLRLRAVEQVQAGVHPEDVAQTLGLHRKTVYGWLAKFREGGREALAAKPVPGRPPKLSGAQIARLYELIVGAEMTRPSRVKAPATASEWAQVSRVDVGANACEEMLSLAPPPGRGQGPPFRRREP